MFKKILLYVIIIKKKLINEHGKDKKMKLFRKEKETKKYYDKGQIFVKIMAAFLALLMLVGTVGSLIYALF